MKEHEAISNLVILGIVALWQALKSNGGVINTKKPPHCNLYRLNWC
jgi:hypothetical protein